MPSEIAIALKCSLCCTAQAICRWLLKRCLRGGMELVAKQAGGFSRDLLPCYQAIAAHLPAKTSAPTERSNPRRAGWRLTCGCLTRVGRAVGTGPRWLWTRCSSRAFVCHRRLEHQTVRSSGT